MSLRHSPVLTPASLAARCGNARKSTGPRTVGGKARSALNSLKQGRYARRLHPRLLRAESWAGAESLSPPAICPGYRDCQRMAAEAWCRFGGLWRPVGAKLESPFDSDSNPLWFLEAVSRLAGVQSGFEGPAAGIAGDGFRVPHHEGT